MITLVIVVALVVLVVAIARAASVGSLDARRRQGGPRDGNDREPVPAWYWLLVAVLVIFGTLGIFSIGAPFLIMGVTLAVVAPYRKRAAALWPPIIAVVAFTAAFVLVAPLGCTSTWSADATSTTESTTCTNLVGIDYSGSGTYNPSLLPALITAVLSAAVAAGVTRLWLRHRLPRAGQGNAARVEPETTP